MRTLNHTLERNVVEADGRYLGEQELKSFETYLNSFETRVSAYNHLRDQSAQMIAKVLHQFTLEYPDLMKKHGKRCQYDMTEVTRYIALSVLRDDDEFFMEQMVSWLDTIILAYKRTEHCVTAYRHLKKYFQNSMPPEEFQLISPYVDRVIVCLDGHA